MSEDKRQSNKENLRLFQLDALLQNQEYYTAEQLKDKLGVSPATFNRVIKSLREQYNAPLEFDKTKGAYHYSSRLFKLPSVFYTEEEMPAYSMALKLFSLFQNTPLYYPLLNICEAFESPIQSKAYIGPDIQSSEVEFTSGEINPKEWFETRIVMAERPTDSIDTDVWELILKALKNNHPLQFDYEAITDNRKSYARIVEPWQLILDRGQWYITGLATRHNSNDDKIVRTFLVSKMTGIKLLNTHFSLPSEEQWMLDKYGIGPFGVATSGSEKEYKFIFQRSALYLTEEVFGKNQKTEKYTGPLPHDDNAILLTFTSNKAPAIMQEFFAYGSDIVPIEPEDFVQKWKDKVQKMTEYL